jgi:hypothetical protein
MGLAALKRYGFDGAGEDSCAKKRHRMSENTEQDDAAGARCRAVSAPATVGAYKRCGWSVRGDTGINLDDWLAQEVEESEEGAGKMASPVMYAIVHWGYLPKI